MGVSLIGYKILMRQSLWSVLPLMQVLNKRIATDKKRIQKYDEFELNLLPAFEFHQFD